MTNKFFATAAAALLTVGIASAANAQSSNLYNNKEANLQAMRWYAAQQMSMGAPNPYPGVNLNNGAGFSEFKKNNGLYANYGTNYGNLYGYGYGYNGYNNYNNYNNPYYNNYGYSTPLYGYNGGYWY